MSPCVYTLAVLSIVSKKSACSVATADTKATQIRNKSLK